MLPEPYLGELKQALRESSQVAPQERVDALARLRAEQDRLARRQKLLYEDRLDGRITAADYDSRAAELTAGAEKVAVRTQAVEAATAAHQREGLLLFETASSLSFAMGLASRGETRRAIVEAACSNPTLRAGRVETAWQEPFSILADAARHAAGREGVARAGVEFGGAGTPNFEPRRVAVDLLAALAQPMLAARLRRLRALLQAA